MNTKKNTQIKTAPNSKESEMMVLGCCLTSVNSLNIAADSLEENDFYYTEHKKIYRVIKEAYKKDKPADIHIIAEELKRQNILEEIGNISYLTTLAQYAGTSAYIEEYVQIVKDKSTLRKMLQATENIEKTILQEPEDVKETLDNAQNEFFQISQNVNFHEHLIIKDILSGLKSESKIPYLKELQQRQEEFIKKGPDEPRITGIPTHFLDFDKLINGLGNSNLMILAARPAMGKTALALNIAENVCFKNNLCVGIFSLEMTAEQILHRIICSQSDVESEKIKNGSIDGREYQKIVSCVNHIQEKKLIIDDQPSLKITDLRARARRMKEAFDIGFIVIDYLQLLSGSGNLRSLENRQNEISEISRMLKNLARELNIPVLCLSQLSRKVEERQGHRPMMSDLRESGCLTGDTIIKDADTDKIYTIKELSSREVQTPINIIGVGDDLKLKKSLMTRAFYSGKKQVYKLKTRSEREIKASANHKFLTAKGWVPLENLKLKDKIAISNRLLVDEISSPTSTKKHFEKSIKPVIFDEITDMEKLGIEDVFDATVEEIHNFIANDIIVHNSLEQDSDLVFFLLRREYYDPYDKPGQAELIVAKNRHGSVGSINLTFRKEVAKFENFTGMQTTVEDNEVAFSNFSPEN